MRKRIDILKGILPGKVIERDLRKRGLVCDAFAKMIGVEAQVLEAVIAGRRELTPDMAVRIEERLGYEKEFLWELQRFYEMERCEKENCRKAVTGVPDIRRSLFWDADFVSIDWAVCREAVIRRVLERGNEKEKREIARYYGMTEESLEMYKPVNSYRTNACASKQA